MQRWKITDLDTFRVDRLRSEARDRWRQLAVRTDSIHGRRALRYWHIAACETTIEPGNKAKIFFPSDFTFLPSSTPDYSITRTLFTRYTGRRGQE